MEVESWPESAPASADTDDNPPQIAVCETCPGTFVFLEDGNSNGWIAVDSPIDAHR